MIEEREVDDMMLKETEKLLQEALGEAPPAPAVPPATTGVQNGGVVNMGTATNVGHTFYIREQTQHVGKK